MPALPEEALRAMTEVVKVEPQTEFSERYRFVSACVHCGKPMGSMSVERYESIGPGQVELRDVLRMWIDPEHDCTYLRIEPKKTEISA